MNIFVSNLAFTVSEDVVKSLFTPFGEVTSARIVTDRETGRSRGFAFVEMPDGLAGQNAMNALDQKLVDGRTINVVKARPKESNSGFEGRSNSGGYNKKW